MDEATVYFQKHQVPELVDGLLDKVLKTMPSNPQQFIADQLTKHVDTAFPVEFSYPFEYTNNSTTEKQRTNNNKANLPLAVTLPPLGPSGSLSGSYQMDDDSGVGNSPGQEQQQRGKQGRPPALSVPEILTLDKYAMLRDTATSTGASLEQCITDCVTDYMASGNPSQHGHHQQHAKVSYESSVPPFPLDSECVNLFAPLFGPFINGQHQVRLDMTMAANMEDGDSSAAAAAAKHKKQQDINNSNKMGSNTGSGQSLGNQGPVSEGDLAFIYESDPSANRVKGGFALEYVNSAVVRLRRNVKAYRFSAGMSRAERKDLAKQIATRCPRCPRLEGGEYVDSLPGAQAGAQAATEEMSGLPTMMQPRASKRCHKSAQEWPHQRGVFVTNDHLLGVLVGNLEEHVEIVAVATDGNLREAYDRAYDACGQLESELISAGRGGFQRHPLLGYLECNPTFLGSGLTFEICLMLPLLAQEPDLPDILAKFGLSTLGDDDAPLPLADQAASDASGEFAPEAASGSGLQDRDLGALAASDEDDSSRGTDLEGDVAELAQNPLAGALVVRNAVTLRYNEWQQLQATVDGCGRLVELEQRLETGDSIEGAW